MQDKNTLEMIIHTRNAKRDQILSHSVIKHSCMIIYKLDIHDISYFIIVRVICTYSIYMEKFLKMSKLRLTRVKAEHVVDVAKKLFPS